MESGSGVRSGRLLDRLAPCQFATAITAPRSGIRSGLRRPYASYLRMVGAWQHRQLGRLRGSGIGGRGDGPCSEKGVHQRRPGIPARDAGGASRGERSRCRSHAGSSGSRDRCGGPPHLFWTVAGRRSRSGRTRVRVACRTSRGADRQFPGQSYRLRAYLAIILIA